MWTEGHVLPTCLEEILAHDIEEGLPSQEDLDEDDIVNIYSEEDSDSDSD